MVGVKPGDYFIGIIEFFGSLVPGVVLVGVLWRLGVLPGTVDSDLVGFSGSAMWVAFTVAAYLTGQVTSVVSSLLDTSYDAVRNIRWEREKDFEYMRARSIMRKSADAADASAVSSNAFQWSKARLVVRGQHEGMNDVRSYEAASKLFRTLVVVAAVIAGVCAVQGRADRMLVAFVGAIICFFPYVDRRYKSTELAYRLVIALDEVGRETSKREGSSS
jgi:hypothetical protein